MKKDKFTILNSKTAGISLLVLVLAGCIQEPSNGSRKLSTKGSSTSFYYSVNEGNGLVLLDNPIILSKNTSLSDSANLANYVKEAAITTNQFLIGSCTGNGEGLGDVSACFNVLEKSLADPLTYKNKRWGYAPGTSGWTQVQTFYHLAAQTTAFSKTLKTAYDATQYLETSIPRSLYGDGANWNKYKSLIAYSNNGVENSAFFSPSLFSVNFGQIKDHSAVLMVQDPAVIYHETGHALISIMMNLRNAQRSDRSELGYLYYDESGAINEGLSDYLSYYMNKRTHFAEWALGRFLGYSRPLTESDPLHMPGISKDDDERLAYPTYLIYDPNFHKIVLEEIHNAGMITSHLLVSLGEELQSRCLMSQSQSIEATMMYIMQTLAELGDLTATAYDGNATSRVNLNSVSSLDWIKIANPINYRNFAQTLAKYIYLSNGTTGCFPQDDLEKFFDKYGLLLFKTYNLNGNNYAQGHSGTNVSVNSSNRLKSILINKEFIQYDPNTTYQAFVFDNQTEMKTAITSLQAAGVIGQLSTQIPSDLSYNNGNSQISPGEVVGLALNLFNASSSPMAGIQILANDWDHFNADSTPRPCSNLGDEFPTESEGGSVDGDTSCSYVTRDNGQKANFNDPSNQNTKESLMPVCFIQKTGSDGASKWVSQSELASSLPDTSYCLSGTTNTKDCFIRAIKGADTAYYSYLAPNSTWAKTLTNGTTAPKYSYSNIIFFEVNSRTPPGTTFNCRFRVRFSNCEDCYHDSSASGDNYLDYEYSGHKPFKIINLQFSVVK